MRNGLTALRVRRLIKPGRHADGGGLYLAISDRGAKSWVFTWKRNGVRRAVGRGSANTVSLAEAREPLRMIARSSVRAATRPRRERVRPACQPSANALMPTSPTTRRLGPMPNIGIRSGSA